MISKKRFKYPYSALFHGLVGFCIFASIGTLKAQEKQLSETQSSEKQNSVTTDPWQSARDQITVTGSRRNKLLKDTVVKTEVINRDDLDSMGARTIADALGNVPGIEVRPAQPGERGETVRLQGLSAKNVLILVDGQRVTGRFSGAIDLTRFKVEDIERIEIVKGASSALYGSDAIAGVINIITREAKTDYQSDFRSLYGTGRRLYYGTGGEFRNSGSIGIREDFYSTQFTAGWHSGDGYDLTPDSTPGAKNHRFQSQRAGYDPTPTNQNPIVQTAMIRSGISSNPPLENTTGNRFQDLNVSNKTIFDLSHDTKLLFNGFYRYLDQEGVDSSPPRRVFDRRNETHDFMGAVGLESNWNEKTHISLNLNHSLFQDRFTYDQRNSDELNKHENMKTTTTEFRSRVDFLQFTSHTVSLGAETLLEGITSPRVEVDCAKNFPHFCLNDRLGLPPAKDSGSATRHRNAVFIQDEWKVSDQHKFTIVPGLRYEHDSQFGSQAMPKLSVRWDPSKEYIFRGSVGLGYRAPNFVELYYDFQNAGAGYRVAGNEKLLPEISKSTNIGGEWEPHRKYWFSWNAFHNYVDNLIGFRLQANRDPNGLQIFQTSNFEKARTQGIETSVNWKISSQWTASLGYTYTDSQDLRTKLPIEGVVFHRYNASLRYYNENIRAGFSIFGISFAKQPFYCEIDGLSCAPEPGTLSSDIYSLYRNSAPVDEWKRNIPLPIQKMCTERNISLCNDEPVFGYRMVNAFHNVNLRVFKKIGNNLEIFAGVDNMLEEFDLVYNPQRPRFFYFGLNGSFTAMKDK